MPRNGSNGGRWKAKAEGPDRGKPEAGHTGAANREAASQPRKATSGEASVGMPLHKTVEHILNRGIVIETWATIALIGLRVVGIEAEVHVASFDTYLRYADALGETQFAEAV